MKYIRKFSTTAEYKQYYNDIDNYVSPNLYLCSDTSNGLHINPTEKRLVAKFYTTKPDEEVLLLSYIIGNYDIRNCLDKIEIDEDDIYTDKNGNKHEVFIDNFYTVPWYYTFKNVGAHIVRYTLKEHGILLEESPSGSITLWLSLGPIIGPGMFHQCYKLAGVKIPYGVTNICDYAFAETFETYVLFPTRVVIPDSVTSIGRYAFGMCYGILHIVIGSSVTEILNGAFATGEGNVIESITCKAKVAPPYTDYYAAFAVKSPRLHGGTLYIPKGATGYDGWAAALGKDYEPWAVVEI